MSCTTGCRTRDHSSYAECLRNKAPRVLWAKSAKGLDLSREKAHQHEIDSYRDAVRQGMDPEGSTTPKIRAAEAWSQKTGVAYTRENALDHKIKKVLG